MRRILHEPFVHFLLLGAAIFAIAHFSNPDAARHRITVSPERITRIVETYRRQYGAPPEPAQLESLIDQDIREEILYREGVALNLDKDDQIVRRRIAQKFEFLQVDRISAADIDEADLRAFYESHRTDYASPARVSFTHVYFSADGNSDARSRAARRRGEL